MYTELYSGSYDIKLSGLASEVDLKRQHTALLDTLIEYDSAKERSGRTQATEWNMMSIQDVDLSFKRSQMGG